jgi:GNAT superfamily N-acetyltransferase
MAHPDCQNKGIGTSLLKKIETYYKNKIFEPFASDKSEKNIKLYLKMDIKNLNGKKYRMI